MSKEKQETPQVSQAPKVQLHKYFFPDAGLSVEAESLEKAQEKINNLTK